MLLPVPDGQCDERWGGNLTNLIPRARPHRGLRPVYKCCNKNCDTKKMLFMRYTSAADINKRLSIDRKFNSIMQSFSYS